MVVCRSKPRFHAGLRVCRYEHSDPVPPKSDDLGGISLEKVTSFEGRFILSTCLSAVDGELFDGWNELPPASAGGFGLFFDLRRRFCMGLLDFQDDILFPYWYSF